jgi:nucleotide-binding universal stress UspA family protein
MATHGRSGIQRWLLGSVAEKTLRRARNPLLLVRPDEKMSSSGVAPLKKIIVPLDGSRLAERALEHAEGLAKKLQAAIILARVYQVPVMTYFAGEGDTPDVARITEQVMTQLKREAERYLEQKIVELRSRGLTDVSFVLLEGDAGTEIIDFARRTGENLVVMSSHGRSGLNRALMGSVAERVARHSGDPVLIVRVASEY